MGESSEFSIPEDYTSDNAPEELGKTRIIAEQGYHRNYRNGFNVYLVDPDFETINIPGSSPFDDEKWEEQRKAINNAKEKFTGTREGITIPHWGPLHSYTVNGREVIQQDRLFFMVTTLYTRDKAYLVYTGDNGSDVIEANNLRGYVKNQNIGISVIDGRSAHLIKYFQDWERAAIKGDMGKMQNVWERINNGYRGIYNYVDKPNIPPQLAIAIRASSIRYIEPIGQR